MAKRNPKGKVPFSVYITPDCRKRLEILFFQYNHVSFRGSGTSKGRLNFSRIVEALINLHFREKSLCAERSEVSDLLK